MINDKSTLKVSTALNPHKQNFKEEILLKTQPESSLSLFYYLIRCSDLDAYNFNGTFLFSFLPYTAAQSSSKRLMETFPGVNYFTERKYDPHT